MSWLSKVTAKAQALTGKGPTSPASSRSNTLTSERPRHIAIIMDGNGRWAKSKGLPRSAGHKAGMDAFKRTVKACDLLGIEYLTVYAFSTENWRRPVEEVSYLMGLVIDGLTSQLPELSERGAKVTIIGDLKGLPPDVQKAARKAMESTAGNGGLKLQIALNYGSRAEIIDACRHIAKQAQLGRLNPEALDEMQFSEFLLTRDLPDPDLIIRTGGENRLSNFLLWQAAYAELWVTNVHWPDFGEETLRQGIDAFIQRERRFGGLADVAKDSVSQ